jgi:hypothetical protein
VIIFLDSPSIPLAEDSSQKGVRKPVSPLPARCTVVIQRNLAALSSEVGGGQLRTDDNCLLIACVKNTVMKEEKINRGKLLQVRLTSKELEKIQNKFSGSTCRKLSDYVRKVLLDKPITVNQRNQSLDDFMAEMTALRRELNAIGANYNQLIKRLHSLQDTSEIKTWLLLNESTKQILVNKIAEIKSKINQLNNQWLR